MEIGYSSDIIHTPEFSSVHSSEQLRRGSLPDSIPTEGGLYGLEGIGLG